MRPLDPRRARQLVGWLVALGAVAALAFVVPGTSSAFTARITNSVNAASAKARFLCADTFAGERRRSRAYFEFALDEPAGATTAADSSDSGNPGTYEGSNAKDADAPIACPNDGGAAYRLDGSSSRITTHRLLGPITGTFSIEVWFRTTSAGKVLGFEAEPENRSNNYDKHLYVNNSGRLVFGIYNGTVQTLTTPTSVTDGDWHHAAATTSSSGSILYVDGKEVDSNSAYTTAEGFRGYWRIGQGNLDSWPDPPGGDNRFTGSLRFAAAYPYVLTPEEVAAEASIGAPGTARAQPTASPSVTPEPSGTPTTSSTPAVTGKPSATPGPAASVSSPPQPVEPGPEVTAAPDGGEATLSPSDPSPTKTTSTPIYQPDPSSPDISTVPDDR